MANYFRSYRLLTSLSPIALTLAAMACSGGDSPPEGSGGTQGGDGGSSDGAGGSTTSGGNENGSGGALGGEGPGETGGTAGGGAATGGAAPSGGTGGDDPTGVPGTDGYDCSAASGAPPVLQATAVVTSGLANPMVLTHEPNGDADRLFVLERGGRVRLIDEGELVATPFLDISSKVVVGMMGGDERGALGIAFHPDYADNGLFYIHYNRSSGGQSSGESVIEEYQVTDDADIADPNSGRVVLTVPQPQRNHKGGSINFGLDGFLYIGLGDGGGANDPQGNGQNVEALLGKFLRINPVASGGQPYSVPEGNLKDTVSEAAAEVWSYGFRNPFRSTFDGCTGDLYIGDVGQNLWEEIDIEKPGDGGRNYGWNTMEGKHCFRPMSGCDQDGLTLPVLEYDRDAGQSVTGGAVYRGASIPGIRGAYFYADYQSNRVWMTVYDREANTASNPVNLAQDLNNLSQIVAINNGADGELYFVSLLGGVYRLASAE